MNLHAIASGVIGAVHPAEVATFRASTGYTTAPDGTRTPSYAPDVAVLVQWQDLMGGPLNQRDGVTQQSDTSKVWLTGTAAAVIRQEGVGGDLFLRADGSLHLVTQIIEQWPEWVSAELTRQMLTP